VSSPKICPQCGAEYELDQRFCPQDGTTLRLQNATGDLVGAIVADRYQVLRKLGEGGMGQVYLVEHVKMGRKSALKVMNPAMVKDADAISRFNREAANASRINHPNVADVYDFGETPDGIIYLAMEFVDGPPLTKLIEQEGPLPPARAAAIVRQTADALAVAHDMGIVHRDLKPDNIMIGRSRDGSDWVKVVDFGIAKAADNAAQKVTKTGLVVGTPEYMSPEQLAGDRLDGRSDIYALGLVAFNMLTGRLPFPAETVQESMIMRLTEAPRRLSEMRPEVAWSADVQGALDKALERDANARYQTATDFGRVLSGALERMGASQGSATRISHGIAAAAAMGAPAHDALPPTRVGANRGPGATVGVPNAAPAAAAQAARPARRRNTALAAGAGGLLLIGALAAAMVIRQGDGKAANVTPAGRPTSEVSPAGNTDRLSKQMDTAAFSKTLPAVDAAAASRASAAAVAARLDSLEKIVSGDVTSDVAGDIIRELEQMRGRIKGNEQLVHAAVVRALAEGSRNDNAAACAALRSVQSIAPGTRRAKEVEHGITGCD
jgi:predicted Ser/Thr protein kinase